MSLTLIEPSGEWGADIAVFNMLSTAMAISSTWTRSAIYLAITSAHVWCAQALVVVATDLMALTLITPPGKWGADIAVCSTCFVIDMTYKLNLDQKRYLPCHHHC